MSKAVSEPIALPSAETLSRRYGRPYRTCVGLQANCWLSVWGTPRQDEWLSYCNSASAQSTCQIVLAHPVSITDKLASRKIHHEVQISYVR